MSAQFQGDVSGTGSYKAILCDNSTGCGEVDDYFATEADAMIYIVYEDDLN